MPIMFATYSKCSMKLSMSWVMLVLDMVVWGAASMPITPFFSPTARISSSLAMRLVGQMPFAPTWEAMMGLLECITAS